MREKHGLSACVTLPLRQFYLWFHFSWCIFLCHFPNEKLLTIYKLMICTDVLQFQHVFQYSIWIWSTFPLSDSSIPFRSICPSAWALYALSISLSRSLSLYFPLNFVLSSLSLVFAFCFGIISTAFTKDCIICCVASLPC